jgi:hypothetical protein
MNVEYGDQLDPGLAALAAELDLYEDAPTPMSLVFLGDVTIMRCRECDGMVFPEDFSGRLGHLLLEHGYRMNGHRYDNRNREVHGDE